MQNMLQKVTEDFVAFKASKVTASNHFYSRLHSVLWRLAFDQNNFNRSKPFLSDDCASVLFKPFEKSH